MYCPACGTYNPETSVFCSQCSAKLPIGIRAQDQGMPRLSPIAQMIQASGAAHSRNKARAHSTNH